MIVKIAARLGIHPAVVCIKWAVQRGQTPIPFSSHRRNYLANLRGVVGAPLTAEDMTAIRTHRPQLPPDQGTGISVEGRPDLGRSLGPARRDHPSVMIACRPATIRSSRETAETEAMSETMRAAYLPGNSTVEMRDRAGPGPGSRRSPARGEGFHHLRLGHSLHLSRASGQRPGRLSGRDCGPRACRADCRAGPGCRRFKAATA